LKLSISLIKRHYLDETKAKGATYETKGFSSIPAYARTRGGWLASIRSGKFGAGHEDHSD
jgi:hypothetical protein